MKAILTYHSVDRSGSPVSVAPEVFAQHVRWLASGSIRVVPLEAIASDDAPGDAVAITFDDGVESVGSVAAPLLMERALPATLFVVTGHVGGTNVWDDGPGARVPRMRLMDWDTLALLAGGGLALGAHTRSHADLTLLKGDPLEREIAEPAMVIERYTGRRPDAFAYPYGRVSRAAAACVARHYRCGCTTELRMLREIEDAACLPRLDAYYFRRPGMLESWGTARFTGYVRARALARRVRGAPLVARALA